MLRWMAASLLLALALSAPHGARAAAPVFTPTPCSGDFAGQPRKVDCGMLVVDESRGTVSPRRIALPVAIVHASDPKPGLPPVVYLHGGPGASSIQGLAHLLTEPEGREMIAIDQDWIFFDQRGGLLAAPNLGCGRAALNDAGPLSDGAARTLMACGERYAAAGLDLTRYNSAEVARDVQDLRQALGLSQVDLYGVSYGTRVGFAILTHAPQGVRAVVMDSPWPPEAMWAQGGPQMVAAAVKLVFTRCAADAACHAKHPTLGADFDAFARRLLAQPLVVNGRTYTADDLGGFLMDATYDDQGARSLPRDLSHIMGGDMTALNAQMEDRSSYTAGQHLAVLCKEEFPFESRDAVAQGAGDDPVARLLVASMQRYFDVCRGWPVGAADPVEQQPVSSPLPTLFLAAEIDPGCPPQLARAAVARFARGQLVIAPNTTHGVAENSACGRRMVRAFFANPAAPVDPGCLHPEKDSFVFDLRE